MATVCILMRADKTGRGPPIKEGEEPWQRDIPRGELVVEIPEEKRFPKGELVPNFRLLSDPEVVFFASPTDILPLDDNQLYYLLAVQPASVRLREFMREVDMKEKMDLEVGDTVIFKWSIQPKSTEFHVNGMIRYIGPLPETEGVYFGIEILEKQYCGKGNTDGRPHFNCDPNNAVYVTMDKILKKVKISQQASPRSKPFTGQPTSKTPSGPLADSYQSQFQSGQRVVLQPAKGDTITGTVRWVGPIKDPTHGRIPAVGVETDQKINPDKLFPDLHLNVTGSHGVQLFKVPYSHGRVYLPEQLVLPAETYAEQRAKENALKYKANELGLKVEEVQNQEGLLRKAKQNRSKIWDKKKPEPGEGEELAAAGIGQFKSEDNVDLTQSVYMAQIGGTLDAERIRQEKRALELMKSQHEAPKSDYTDAPSADYQVGHRDGGYQAFPYAMRYKEEQHIYSTQVTPESNHSSRHPPLNGGLTSIPNAPLNDASTSLQFTTGSMVYVPTQRGQPLYGVVQWIGTVPDFPGTIAGVELEEPMTGCTDGTWQGRRFFNCPPGRAFFCPATALQKDRREDKSLSQNSQKQGESGHQNEELEAQITELKEAVHRLQQSNESLQLQKASIEDEKKDKERAHQQTKREKEQLQERKKQLEDQNVLLKGEKRQLEEQKQQLERQLIDLTAMYTQLQQEMTDKDHVQSQLQSQVARFSIENMRLKGQVKQLEDSSVSDIRYWEVSHSQVLTNGVTLGEGGWGKVLVGLFQGQKVALKMLHSGIVSPYYNQLVCREICMMAKVRHPNLLLFVAAVLDHPSGSPIIITELLDTSLRKAYQDKLLTNEGMKLCLMTEVASALNYLHGHRDRIIHRDVSSANVLLEARGGSNWKAKLSDFGSANLVQYSTTTGPGAVVYAAPEVPQNQTPKMDVYSYGILLCEVLVGEFPFPQVFPGMLQSLAQRRLLYQLILSCTKHSPDERPDMDYVLHTLNEKFSDIQLEQFKPL